MISRGARFYAMDKIAFLQALILSSRNRLALLVKGYSLSKQCQLFSDRSFTQG